jgi:hypothetical protein
MAQRVEQAIVTSRASVKRGQETTKLALFNPDGTPYSASKSVSTKTQIVALTPVAAANAVAAAGANPTKAEYDALVTLANENKAKLNAVIAALKA